jgi:pimeloyl-ACP methyl ester carboxylesterase
MKKPLLWTVLAMLMGIGSTLVLGQADARRDTAPAGELAGKLPDGSNYRVVKPERWNGTLVLDLDFINNPSAPPSAIEQWMVAGGYAIGGISREPIAYRFPQAVDDLLAVRTMLIERWGATPARTLSLGNSRGAFVSRIALERRPDIFAGAMMSAGGGAGEVGLHNAKLDALWALKQFSGVPLIVAGFSSQAEAAAEGARIQQAVKTLQATPLGRARLALAAAFEQLPVWSDGDQPSDTDLEAQVDQLAIGFGAGHPAVVRYNIEQTAGGVFSWNHGVDYEQLLSRSSLSPMVRALYQKAGADLAADLRTLAAAPRITASPAAVGVVERTMGYSGKIAAPVFVVDNIADPFDVESFDRAYEDNVTSAGNAALLRMTWVRSARHSTQSPLERLTGFSVLIERLDTGRWPDISPTAMNARGEQLRRATTIDLGPARFIAYQPPAILRPWDGRHWGTYRLP